MKRIFVISVALLALGACTNEVDEVFDTPASDRLNDRMLECQRLLAAPEHGWMVIYYPSSTRQFGGSTYMMKFDTDGNVAVTGEMAADLGKDVSDIITSHYSIKSSSSVVLAFDTYNDYIHYWSDPDPYGGNAFDGDFEFEYVGGDESHMTFRGTKTQNEIVFTALGEDMVEAARKEVEMREKIEGNYYATFDWSDGSQTVRLYDDDNFNVMTYYPSGDTEDNYESLPYTFTETGISFYQPVTIGGVTAQNFNYADGGRFVSVDGKDASGTAKEVSLTGAQAENFVNPNDFTGTYMVEGEFSFGYGSFLMATLEKGGTRNEYVLVLDGADEGIDRLVLSYHKSNGTLSLITQYLGKWSDYYVYLCPWDTESGYLTWSDGIGMTMRPVEGEEISFTFEDNGVWGGNIVTGFLFYAFSGPPSSDTTEGYVYQFIPTSMTKY